MKSHVLPLCGALAMLSLTAAAAAPPSNAMAPMPAKVGFCGPVVKLVEDHCIAVKTSGFGGSHTYEITSANPKPSVGEQIQGSGVADGSPTICMQGTHLTAVTWKKVAVCPR
ncbi:MAG TPA: hypothetical protein VNU97_10460 [Rhizomicrobium sp.]|jgi:hypothetical protein|nr:hypothetical protein [Rhizomicrobium sp.]